VTASDVQLPDAVVFDFDGLMLDTEWTSYESIDAVFAAHGEELSLELWTSFIGTTDHPHWSDILEAQLGRPIDREHWLPRRRADDVERARALDLLPGVGELIAALDGAGVRLAVASSSPASWLVPHLGERGLLGYFAAVCTGDEVERTKPDPALYLLACERLGVEPSRTVAIEDSLHGIEAARAAGMVAVAVPGHLTAHLDYSPADRVVSSCAELTPAGLGALVVAGPAGRRIAR
jgi:HAD superfamily hydrolase (TIGR01509 family)